MKTILLLFEGVFCTISLSFFSIYDCFHWTLSYSRDKSLKPYWVLRTTSSGLWSHIFHSWFQVNIYIFKVWETGEKKKVKKKGGERWQIWGLGAGEERKQQWTQNPTNFCFQLVEKNDFQRREFLRLLIAIIFWICKYLSTIKLISYKRKSILINTIHIMQIFSIKLLRMKTSQTKKGIAEILVKIWNKECIF